MGFDTETTGVDVYADDVRVVTCAMILQKSASEPPSIIEYMMDPEVEIPEGASEVHGITTEYAREHGMNYREGLQNVADLFKYTIENDIPTVAHNASFDATLLRIEFINQGIDFDQSYWDRILIVDTIVLDRAIDKWRKGGKKLTAVAAHYGYDIGDNAHEATADVLACMHIGRVIIPKFVDFVEKKLGTRPAGFSDLHEIQKHYFKAQMDDLEEYFRRKDPEKTINKSWPFQDREQQ